MKPDEQQGGEVLVALDSVRDFFQGIARLLRSADAWLADECGWTPLGGSQCLTDLSYSLDRPRRWMPTWAGRCYGVPQTTVGFVAALFGTLPNDRLVTRLTEPVVYGGWARYDDAIPSKFQSRWICKLWHWMPVEAYTKRGGTRVAVRQFREAVADGVQIEQGCLEPISLMSVTSSGSLVELVLKPLSEILGQPDSSAKSGSAAP